MFRNSSKSMTTPPDWLFVPAPEPVDLEDPEESTETVIADADYLINLDPRLSRVLAIANARS